MVIVELEPRLPRFQRHRPGPRRPPPAPAARRERSEQGPPPRLPVAIALQRLDAALAARRALLDDVHRTALRLLNDEADGIPGLVIERLADVLVAQCHEGRLALDLDDARAVCERAMNAIGAMAVYRKTFARDRSAALPSLEALHRDPTPWIGSPAAPELVVEEHGMRFLVRPYDGYAFGLFLDQRDNRARARALSAGRRVLNLFAYTCGFSVAAALGGAEQVVSVDVSKRSLEWGKRNFTANGLDLGRALFICSDALDYFVRARRQGRLFDLVIVDPPTFARIKGTRRVFSIERDLDALLAAALERLTPGGQILLSTNHRGTSAARLEAALHAAAAPRRLTIEDRPRLPADFAGDAEYAKSLLARLT